MGPVPVPAPGPVPAHSGLPHVHCDLGEQVQLLHPDQAVGQRVDPVFVHRLAGVGDPVEPATGTSRTVSTELQKGQFPENQNQQGALPLRVGLVLLVPVVSDHAALPHLSAGSGDAHPFGGQPGSRTGSAVVPE